LTTLQALQGATEGPLADGAQRRELNSTGKVPISETTTCGAVKKLYKEHQCCGHPATNVSSGKSCSNYKTFYKYQECCGAPAKVIRKPF